MAMKGRENLRRVMAALAGPRAELVIGRALFAAGERIAVEAQLSITRGAVSGANHVPSSPGEAPNQDSGVLSGNIETVQKKPLVVEVSSNAPYSSDLEFGTSRMASRPFMRPARDKEEKNARAIVAKALDKFIRSVA